MLNIRQFTNGLRIIPVSSHSINRMGELEVLVSDGKLYYHNGTSVSVVATNDNTLTFTNKIIDAGSNTFTNISLTSSITGTLAISNGGTGQTTANAGFNALSPMTTGGDLIYGGASGVGTRLANGTNGQVLTSSGGTSAPTWTTSTAGFTNPMTTSGDTIYGGVSGVATRLPKGSDGQILTLASGLPTWATSSFSGTLAIANGGTGQTTNSAAFAALSPGHGNGSILYADGSVFQELIGNISTTRKFLRSTGSGLSFNAPAWDTVIAADISSGQIAIANGGTGASSKSAGFDALSPMTTSGDIIYGGTSGTGTRLPKGSDGNFLKLVSGLPAWGSATASLAVTTKTTTYSITTADDAILVNPSGNFTITLPTAIGNTGKVFYMKKIANDSSNIVTIATTSSQTIDGVTSRKLNTYNESWVVVSDGSNWQVIEHKTISQLVTYTPTTQGFGTITSPNFLFRRIGECLEIICTFTTGTPTATEARIGLPSGCTTSSILTATVTRAGDAMIGATSVPYQTHVIAQASVTYFNFGRSLNTSDPTVLVNGNDLFPVGTKVSFIAKIPISGWDE